jgi:hypothetical protein
MDVVEFHDCVVWRAPPPPHCRFNPWQLYVGDQDNMQAEWYGREDFSLEIAINNLKDKSTVLLPWFYSWPEDTDSVAGSLHGASFKASSVVGHSHPAFEFQGEWPLGFRTVGCPFEVRQCPIYVVCMSMP